MRSSFIRFSFVGFTCFCLNTLFFFILIDIFRMHYFLATVACFFFINLVGFILNKSFTFGFQGRFLVSAIRYFSVMAFSLTSNLFLMWILVGLLRFHYIIASLIISVIMLLFNFSIHRAWSFGSIAK